MDTTLRDKAARSRHAVLPPKECWHTQSLSDNFPLAAAGTAFWRLPPVGLDPVSEWFPATGGRAPGPRATGSGSQGRHMTKKTVTDLSACRFPPSTPVHLVHPRTSFF